MATTWVVDLGRSVAEYFAGIGLTPPGREQAGSEGCFGQMTFRPTKQAMYLGHFGYRKNSLPR